MSSVLRGNFNRRATDPSRRMTDHSATTARTLVPVKAEGTKVSWGGVWGGVLLAIGLIVLLTALGAAIGITAADPVQTDASTAGRNAGIFAAASLLLALFFGGWASTRMGAITDRATGFCEGALVWVVSVLLVGVLATSGVGMLAGGAFDMLGGASEALGSVMQQGSDAVSGGNTEQLQQKAQEVKPAAAKGAWITFGALLLSLVTAVIGAMVGRREPEVKTVPVRR